MPIGFLVDKVLENKNYLVLLGAVVIFISILIMFLLISNRDLMEVFLPAEKWFILSSILTPVGYVIQDVVADALTVEAVENKSNNKYKKEISKRNEHMLLQLYGRFSIILGSLLVGLINIYFFLWCEKYERKSNIASIYKRLFFSFIYSFAFN